MDNYLLIGMLAVFVGLLFVQSRNRKKQANQMQEGLKPGAEVMLTSGIIGTVVAVAGDRVIITTAGTTKIEVASGAVLRVLKSVEVSSKSTAAAVKKAQPKPQAKKTSAAKTAANKSKNSKPGGPNGK